MKSCQEAASLLCIELNEFNPDYLLHCAGAMGLTHLQTILSCRHAGTTTSETTGGQGLDPWVQWVSIHTGRPMAVHGIQRFGSTKEQVLPQLWHAVASKGYTWGAWGVMNAPLGDPTGCLFFMPDPWSFAETAYPGYLNDLLALPRYISAHYLNIEYRFIFAATLRLIRFFAPPRHWRIVSRLVTETLKAATKNSLSVHTFTTLLDYLSVLLFVRLRRDRKPGLSIIFLNHMAHLQHHFWLAGEKIHPEMELGLRLCNAMIGLLLGDRRKNEALVVMNGFKQENVAGKGFYSYRQRDQHAALQAMGISGGRVEQNMTDDATMFFSTSNEADRAFEVLERYCLGDRKLYYVERKGDNGLFFQLAFNDYQVPPDAVISDGQRRLLFHDHFQLLGVRTGAHIPDGDIFYDGIEIPAHLQNHEIFNYILAYFDQCQNPSIPPER